MTGLQGLSESEAAARRASGKDNRAPIASSRSYAQIVRENAFTFINTILFAIGIVLVLMDRVDNALVTAGLVLLNVVVGVTQEVQAKRTLDRIALLTRPKATVIREGQEKSVDPGELVEGDILVARRGDQIVVDGEVVGEGRMEVDESLLTGESDLVPKRAGDSVLSGSFCVTGSAAYVATRVGSQSYANRITAGARAFRRVKTPLQRDIDFVIRVMVLLAGSLGVLLAVAALMKGLPAVAWVEVAAVIVVLVPQGLFLMTTVTYAAGAVRMVGSGLLIQQANAVESLSNVDVLCMDKTGTLTTNQILLHDVLALNMPEAALKSALGDYVASAADQNRTTAAIAAAFGGRARAACASVPFSSARKWSGQSFADDDLRGAFVLGAPEVLAPNLMACDGLQAEIDNRTAAGLRVLLFANAEPLDESWVQADSRLPENLTPLGLVSFSDELRPEAASTIRQFAGAGILLKIISGDNPRTVAALARQAGFISGTEVVSGLDLAGADDARMAEVAERAEIFGRITPEQKEKLVRALRSRGHYVAMTGDGVNDVLSLKGADLGIAMQTGSQATRAVADMVLLNDSFAALPAAFREGQRIIRGMRDIMRLFLARTFYVTLLIIGAGLVGTPFPITPKHNFILALLTVGIPTLALAAWARPVPVPRLEAVGRRTHSTLRAIRHFVFPAALTVAPLAIVVYLFVLYWTGDLAVARTALTTTTVLCGLALIPFVEPPSAAWAGGDELSGDRRPFGLAVLMLITYGVMLALPNLRAFFELTQPSGLEMLLIGVLVTAWAMLLRTIWRKNLFERFFEIE